MISLSPDDYQNMMRNFRHYHNDCRQILTHVSAPAHNGQNDFTIIEFFGIHFSVPALTRFMEFVFSV